MIRKSISALLAGLSVLFGYLYYVQYHKWRACFDEMGRCFDANSGVVYHEQAGIAWLSLTVFTFGIAVFLFLRAPRTN